MVKINIPSLGKTFFVASILVSFNIFSATCEQSTNWCYEQSLDQCFYNFNNAEVFTNSGQPLDPGSFDFTDDTCPSEDCDIIGAFMENEEGDEICVGWAYQNIEIFGIYQVPVMGEYEIYIDSDSSEVIVELSNGKIPIFKIWDASESQVYNAIAINKETFTDGNDNGCWDQNEEYIDENENGMWDPSIIPGFESNVQHFIKELKGLGSETDCNGVEVASSAECTLDSNTPGCADYDDCHICSEGDTCITPTLNDENGFPIGPYADCAGVCSSEDDYGSFIGDCNECLPEDTNSNIYIDCNGDCHPNTPLGCEGDEDCGLKEFDSLFDEYTPESLGCCNPNDMSIWFDDADMDMLGDPALEFDLCMPELITRTLAQNNYDLYPSCFSNSVDDCGVCDGFNLDMDCTGNLEDPETWEAACFGSATEDLCGVCDSNLENDNLACTGCTNESAYNYNPDFLFYDGSCEFIVYPGDTNNDGGVDFDDLLPIGVHWGESGSSRVISSGNDYMWQEQIGYDLWSSTEALFADANGDGLINIFDYLVILFNFNESHLVEPQNTFNSFYENIDIEIYRDNFQELYNSISDENNNNPFKIYLEELLGIESNIEIPETYKLHQNRPNPFNPTTNIIYEVPIGGDIKITITNIMGEIINQYESYILSPGIYNYQFDGSSIPSGIYFYHLQTSSNINITNKMMLIK